MAFSFPWVNRVDNEDYVLASDVNTLAAGVQAAGTHADERADALQEVVGELFTSVSDGKAALVTDIETMGGTVEPAGDVPTFAELGTGILSIPSGGGRLKEANISLDIDMGSMVGTAVSVSVGGDYFPIGVNYGWVASGTTISPVSCVCETGKLVLAATFVRSAVTSVTSGWTLLTSQELSQSGTAYTQTCYIYYKFAGGSSESFQISQAESARIHVTMLCIDSEEAPLEGQKGTTSVDGTGPNNVTLQKTQSGITVFVLHSITWSTATPTPDWRVSPITGGMFAPDSTQIQPRILVAVDDKSAIPHSFYTASDAPISYCSAVIPN